MREILGLHVEAGRILCAEPLELGGWQGLRIGGLAGASQDVSRLLAHDAGQTLGGEVEVAFIERHPEAPAEEVVIRGGDFIVTVGQNVVELRHDGIGELTWHYFGHDSLHWNCDKLVRQRRGVPLLETLAPGR